MFERKKRLSNIFITVLSDGKTEGKIGIFVQSIEKEQTSNQTDRIHQSCFMHREAIRRDSGFSEENTSTSKETTTPSLHYRSFVPIDHDQETEYPNTSLTIERTLRFVLSLYLCSHLFLSTTYL